jgi:DNA-binding GntR family transcriptional regulator
LTDASLIGLDRRTLRERALEALRSAITSGEYLPGDHLSELTLASRLGVSRGTVRQALRHLQQEGLVTTGNRSMLKVNSLSAREVRELFRVRAALEGLAVKQVINLPDRRDAVFILRESLRELTDEQLDFPQRVDADLGFHLQLCRLSGNSMLVDAWCYLEGRIRVVIMNAGPERAPTMMSVDRHKPIIDAIAHGDPASAVAVVNDHMAAAAGHFSPVSG